jgi:ketosteroid isomerase-like protein
MLDVLAEAEGHLRRLAHRYADAINRADFDEVVACYAPDGVWRVPPPFNANHAGRDNIRKRLADRRAQVDLVVMMVGTVVAVEASPGLIRGRTTIHETGRLDAERGLDVLGLYDDELIQNEGEWLFASRTLNLLAYSDVPSTYITMKQYQAS